MMPDREKVISGLQRCRLVNKVNCDKCPYDYNGRGNGKSECTAELADDVLALLKEQEAVKPQTENAVYDIGSWWYICGACKKPIDKMDTFCRHCGQAVKWE